MTKIANMNTSGLKKAVLRRMSSGRNRAMEVRVGFQQAEVRIWSKTALAKMCLGIGSIAFRKVRVGSEAWPEGRLASEALRTVEGDDHVRARL